jgi:D-mannonate dehydratase
MSFGVKGNHQRDRKHPGVRGMRPDNKSFRQTEAAERQAEYDKLSLEQKLEMLSRKPGESKKQRAKLTKLIEARKVQSSAKAENQVQKFLAKQAIAKKS